MIKKIVWTKEIDDALELLLGLDENLSFIEIAARMSAQFKMNFTRNSCIGRTHRLKLPPRPYKPKFGRPTKVKPMSERIDAPIPPKEARRAPGSRNLTIYQLTQGDCRWPEGDRPPLLYCGRPAPDGFSDRPEHHALAYHTPRKSWS